MSRRISLPEPSLLDKAISMVSPETGLRRLKARAVMALYGGYTAARKDRRQTKYWQTSEGSANAVTLPDLPTLRDRSRDLIRNAPLASGAVNTVVTNVVGTGLMVQSRIDRDVLQGILGETEEEFEAFERAAEREFRLWAESQNCDASRTQNFVGLQDLVLRSTLESGDVFALKTFIERPGWPLATALQIIEADRICNPDGKTDTPFLCGGVEIDNYGAPLAYHILKAHPGDVMDKRSRESLRVPAYGRDGARTILHLFIRQRPGLVRGVPYMAPVIESLKQLDKYTEAEIMAAVISAMFTVFVKSEDPDGLSSMNETPAGAQTGRDDDEFRLGSGAILDLMPYESIEIADPKRPNQAFDPFMQAILRQVGVALEIPFEILIKHFTASYSAAQAALVEAWKFFRSRRQWLACSFCQPVYEAVITEAVARGRLHAPGFFSDPIIRAAYLDTEWIGPPRGQIDQLKETNAAKERVNMGISTLAEETAALTGGDWEKKHKQRAKEKRLRVEDGLEGSMAEPSPQENDDETKKLLEEETD
ncbi:MAG: phage portal protein [Alphaproteobacteria bacterium]|nr:phage portal protein [Alphaproteobacteria bacterium]